MKTIEIRLTASQLRYVQQKAGNESVPNYLTKMVDNVLTARMNADDWEDKTITRNRNDGRKWITADPNAKGWKHVNKE